LPNLQRSSSNRALIKRLVTYIGLTLDVIYSSRHS
jgi:hypothetical protein